MTKLQTFPLFSFLAALGIIAWTLAQIINGL